VLVLDVDESVRTHGRLLGTFVDPGTGLEVFEISVEGTSADLGVAASVQSVRCCHWDLGTQRAMLALEASKVEEMRSHLAQRT